MKKKLKIKGFGVELKGFLIGNMQLKTKHIVLAQKLASQIWSETNGHPDYIKEKLNRNNAVDSKVAENIYFFVGQFDIANQHKLYTLAKEKGEKGQELAEWIKENYFKF